MSVCLVLGFIGISLAVTVGSFERRGLSAIIAAAVLVPLFGTAFVFLR